MMDTLFPILLGLALAAACGFRVFAPLLIAGAAAHTGHLTLASDFTWLGTTPALIALTLWVVPGTLLWLLWVPKTADPAPAV